MQNFTDQELEALLDDLESELVERKESFKGSTADKARQAVCAFANDLPDYNRPGILFIGARDDGSPTSLTITDELLRNLGSMKTDAKILPLPTFRFRSVISTGQTWPWLSSCRPICRR
jgi:ATP-dependent DNA helicase RecG